MMTVFLDKIEQLFDIACANASDLTENNEDKLFIENKKKTDDLDQCGPT